MKIGIIQQAPDMGGAEEYTILLAKYFKKDKQKIYFATNNPRFEKLVKGNTVKTFNIPFRLDIIGNYRGLIKSFFLLPYAIIFYINLLSKFKKENVEVILMSGFSEKMLVTFLSIFFNMSVVWVEHGPLKTIFRRNLGIPWIAYRLNIFVKRIIVPANITKQDLVNFGKVSKDKVIVIPDGIEIPKYSRRETRSTRLVIGNVSRLTREKGQEFIILSASEVIKKHPDTKFILVGDGPNKNYYKKLIQELDLSQNFKITGYVKKTSSYYRKFDIFVFPTVWELEGFGLVLAEAMASKVPIIANNIGPVPEVVGNAGILVQPKNIAELSNSINLLIENKEKRRVISERGFLRVRDSYNIEDISKRILEVLEN